MKPTIDGVLAKWRWICGLILLLRVGIVLASTPIDDLVNWANITQVAYDALSRGQMPAISALGVYGYMSLPLVPFFWAWKLLPIDHPPLTYENYLSVHSTPAFYLNLLLKIPLSLADLGAGALVFKLSHMLTGSVKSAKVATILWFANPFNIYWVNIDGAVDIIPALIVLLTVYLCLIKRNFASGIWLAVGGLFRIFPFLTFPFFLVALREKGLRSMAYFCLGCMVPTGLALAALYVSNSGNLEALTLIPTYQTWLLDFLGNNLFGQNVRSAVVVVALQFLICVRFWKKLSYLPMVTVAILALFIGSLAYAGSAHHFMWISPLLTVSVVVNPKEVWAFILTFISAFGLTYPFQPGSWLVGPFLTGVFYGAKSIYLLMINGENIYVGAAATLHQNSLIEQLVLAPPTGAGAL